MTVKPSFLSTASRILSEAAPKGAKVAKDSVDPQEQGNAPKTFEGHLEDLRASTIKKHANFEFPTNPNERTIAALDYYVSDAMELGRYDPTEGLILVKGPVGVGKTTVIRQILKKYGINGDAFQEFNVPTEDMYTLITGVPYVASKASDKGTTDHSLENVRSARLLQAEALFLDEVNRPRNPADQNAMMHLINEGRAGEMVLPKLKVVFIACNTDSGDEVQNIMKSSDAFLTRVHKFIGFKPYLRPEYLTGRLPGELAKKGEISDAAALVVTKFYHKYISENPTLGSAQVKHLFPPRVMAGLARQVDRCIKIMAKTMSEKGADSLFEAKPVVENLLSHTLTERWMDDDHAMTNPAVQSALRVLEQELFRLFFEHPDFIEVQHWENGSAELPKLLKKAEQDPARIMASKFLQALRHEFGPSSPYSLQKGEENKSYAYSNEVRFYSLPTKLWKFSQAIEGLDKETVASYLLVDPAIRAVLTEPEKITTNKEDIQKLKALATRFERELSTSGAVAKV